MKTIDQNSMAGRFVGESLRDFAERYAARAIVARGPRNLHANDDRRPFDFAKRAVSILCQLQQKGGL